MSVSGAGSGPAFFLDRTDGPRDAATPEAAIDSPVASVVRGSSPAMRAVAVPATTEPLSSLLARGDVASVRAVMEEMVLGKAPESRLVELSGLLVMAERGNTPAGRCLGALGTQTGLDMQRVLTSLEGNAAFRRLADRDPLSSADVTAFAKSADGQGALRRAVLREEFRDAVDGSRPADVDRLLAASSGDKPAFARLLTAAIDEDKDLRRFVEADPARTARAQAIALRAQPTDPSVAENRDVNAKVDAFRDWNRYPYALIAVPGYTATNATPAPGVSSQSKDRLVQAKKDFDAGKAPFILLSGGNVHPEGTPFYEALEMKKELVHMGVPADRIIVDAAARHSTTNLRNTGRYMLAHGIGDRKALVTTSPDQDFYFSNAGISTFNARCKSELGYKVGELGDPSGHGLFGDRYHSTFKPASEVRTVDWKQPLDP